MKRFHPLMLLLAGLPILVRPATARTYIECADGSPCVMAGHMGCCQRPGERPPTHCVTKTIPGIILDQAHPTQSANPLIALARIPDEIAIPPAKAIATVVEADESPPNPVTPKQGCAPRAPPIFHI